MKVNVARAVSEMMEYCVSVTMVKSAVLLKGSASKQRSRLRLLLSRLREYTPEDERKFIDVKEVPGGGLANMAVRNLFLKKSHSVIQAAVLAVNDAYLPKYNEVLAISHRSAQAQRAIEGKIVKEYTMKTDPRLEIGRLCCMIEKVDAHENRRAKKGRVAITGHFQTRSKKK